MARINIDDDIESKKEFWRLLPLLGGDRCAALGKLVLFFRIAQKHYGCGEAIPETELRADGLECMIESGWALPYGDGFQVAQPEKHFAWKLQMQQGAKAGGRARSSGPRDRTGKFIPGIQRKPAPLQPSAGFIHPEASPTPAPSSPHAHSHAHSQIQLPTVVGTSPVAAHTVTPVGLWIAAYKHKYSVRYELQKQDTGMITNFAKDRKLEEVARLFACYLAIDSKFYCDNKHPLKFFFSDLQKIAYAAKTGVDPSQPESFDTTKLKD